MTVTAIVETQCPVCKQTSEVVVPVDGMAAWAAGAYIQDAMPELSVDDREKLMTGIDGCWDTIFDGEEE